VDTRTVEPGTGSPNGKANGTAGRDGGVPAQNWQPITARSEVWWWTGAVTLTALVALAISIVAIALHHSATPARSSSGATATAAAPAAGQTIDFNAEPDAGFKARSPEAPAPLPGTVHDITMHIVEKKVEVAPGVSQTLWTFDGEVPGPVYRGHVGDTFNFTIVNDGTMTHSLDFHAGMVSPSVAMVPIQPHESHTYSFVARHAGIFMYHCGTPPVLMHIAQGMYGAVIIDPPGLQPVAHEYVMLQSELYTGKGGAVPDMSKLVDEQYDAVMFNGYVGQYKFAPIEVPANQRIRVWVLDDGPSQSSSFHVIGTIFDTVYKEGAYLLQPGPGLGGSQALDLAPAQGGFVEFTPTEPGSYAFVTHKFNDATRGAVGVFQIG
jgi:nitrite reductase (NO-forming)